MQTGLNSAEGPFDLSLGQSAGNLILSGSLPQWQQFLSFWLAISPQLGINRREAEQFQRVLLQKVEQLRYYLGQVRVQKEIPIGREWLLNAVPFVTLGSAIRSVEGQDGLLVAMLEDGSQEVWSC